MNKLISFIIPAFNAELYIEKCISSILNQTHNNLEVIIINDGSTDETKSVVEGIDDKRIKVINKENRGVSAARNDGLNSAKGDYVVFVDADDYLSDDYADYMLKIVDHTGSDLCLTLNCFTKRRESQVKNDRIECISPEQATTLLLSPRVVVGSWNKMYKRSLLIDNKIEFSTDLFYGEGLRFITQVAQVSNSVGIGLKKVYYYRRNNYMSACTKFKIDNLYNGIESINMIADDLMFNGNKLLKMLNWHKCQFYMGAAVRINSNNKILSYQEFYNECVRYVRQNGWKFIFTKELPIYNRMILLGCAISPTFMGKLDSLRRKQITTESV